MSVPIAVVGWMPKIRISSGVISEPPPIPVMPTSTPIPNPKRTIAGSMVSLPAAPGVLIDFPDLFGQERGVRQDTKMLAADRDLAVRGLGHSYGETRSLEGLDIFVGAQEVVAVVGPSGSGKSTLLELVCGLLEPDRGTIEIGGGAVAGR